MNRTKSTYTVNSDVQKIRISKFKLTIYQNIQKSNIGTRCLLNDAVKFYESFTTDGYILQYWKKPLTISSVIIYFSASLWLFANIFVLRLFIRYYCIFLHCIQLPIAHAMNNYLFIVFRKRNRTFRSRWYLK